MPRRSSNDRITVLVRGPVPLKYMHDRVLSHALAHRLLNDPVEAVDQLVAGLHAVGSRVADAVENGTAEADLLRRDEEWNCAL